MEFFGDRAHAVESWLYCHDCKKETHHTLMYAKWYWEHENEKDDGTVFRYAYTWLIWQCDGCENLTLEDKITEPAYFEGEMDKCSEVLDIYPRRTDLQPKRFLHIPAKIERIYQEAIGAYNDELNILCATGLRGLIEGVCDDKEICRKDDTLNDKIRSLTQLGIRGNMAESLHSLRIMGNDAVHDLTPPEREELRIAIEIIEHLLNHLYDIDYKAKSLGQRPRRRYTAGGSDQH